MMTMHLLFWCMYFSFFFYQISSSPRARQEETPFSEHLLNAFSHTIYLAIVAYINYLWIMPRYLKHKNGFKYVFEFAIAAILVLGLYIPAKRWMVDGYSHQAHFYYSSRFAIGSFVTSVLVSAFVALLRFFTEWKDLEEQREKFRNEKLTAELKFLKNQINPHFLFNTLNNLYSLAYSQSPQTTEVISRLSKMMRYMVYDCSQDKVPLDKEIEYIQNYITLEKLRLNNSIPIEFSIHGEAKDKLIVPLLLIPFLENSFKHGVSNTNDSSWVKASLDCTNGTLKMEVSNSKNKLNGSSASANSGVGLENVRKRLELNYPDRHSLFIFDKDNTYTANLEVQLN